MENKNDKANIPLRMDILFIVTSILFVVLLARLFFMTVVEGDKYREIADNRRIKKVYETAPRGEIRDRHGRLLAGNIPSFTVQVLKDELMRPNQTKEEIKNRNQRLLTLIRLLEEDGVFFQGEFPVDLNYYTFAKEEMYETSEESPQEIMVKKLENEDVLREFIESSMNLDRFPNHYSFNVKQRALNAVREKYIDFPVTLKDNVFVADDLKLKTFIKDKSMKEGLSAEELVFEIIKSDMTIKRKILNHPIARAILFEIAAKSGTISNIRMKPVSISYQNELLIDKLNLVKNYPELSIKDDAKTFFTFLGKRYALKEILSSIYDDGKMVPGEIFLQTVQDKGIAKNIEVYLSEDETGVFYKYNDGTDSKNPLEDLINMASDEVIDEFLMREETRPIVQRELLKKNINAKISVSNELEFVNDKNTKNLYSRFKSYFKDMDDDSELPDAEELLAAAKDYYAISPEISNYEAKDILNIYDLVYKLGERAYKPVNLAYGLKDETVAKIEEKIGEKSGIRVSLEPVRYYPLGQTASHILGYMGRIATDKEIEKYVEDKKYDRNEFIGKTGVEESFEEYLHGKSGEKTVAVDYIGNTTSVMNETKSVPGNTLYLSIDSKLNSLAEEYLEKTIDRVRRRAVYESEWGDYQMDGEIGTKRPFSNCNAGAVVAMNAKTGEVLAMASYPGYDPNLFATGINESDWKNFFPENDNDPLAARPLYNIATQTAVQPGSTFKMVTGFTGLQKGLDPYEKIWDGGYVEVGDTKFRCLVYTLSKASHGNVDLAHAIEHSCNYYFYSLALGNNQRRGEKPISTHISIEDIRNAAEEFGLNDKTGIEINIPPETVGSVPEAEQKMFTTKFYIAKWLRENIRDFLETEKTDDEVENDIKEIANWAEEGRSLTSTELIKRLENMGYNGSTPVKGQKRSLTDVLKFDYINQAPWSLADTLNVTIGQGQSNFTTLQMANYISTLVNGGTRNKVTLFDSVKSYDGQEDVLLPENNPTQIDIKNPDGMNQIKYGMELVSRVGTSRRVFLDFPIATGSKTGTAQREGINPNTNMPYDDFAWFVSYAPADDPEIVVASVLFQGGTGSNAGPMARDLMAEYLGLNRVDTKNVMPFRNELIK